MAKTNVTLILEYDMGDYADMLEDGNSIPTNPEEWGESFFQSDVFVCDMKIVGVKIGDSPNKKTT